MILELLNEGHQPRSVIFYGNFSTLFVMDDGMLIFAL